MKVKILLSFCVSGHFGLALCSRGLLGPKACSRVLLLHGPAAHRRTRSTFLPFRPSRNPAECTAHALCVLAFRFAAGPVEKSGPGPITRTAPPRPRPQPGPGPGFSVPAWARRSPAGRWVISAVHCDRTALRADRANKTTAGSSIPKTLAIFFLLQRRMGKGSVGGHLGRLRR
jgi:hypothetical protein